MQVFETGSPLLYTGSNNTLQSGYFTIFAPSIAGTLIPATGSISASIIPPLVTTDSGVSSSFAVVYRDSKGVLSSYISQSHRVAVVSDGINGASGSDARAVRLTSDRYTFTYDQNGSLTPLTAQTASLTASAQTGSADKPWGANIYYQFQKNGTTVSPANWSSPFWIISSSTGASAYPSPGSRDFWQINLLSGSGQTLVAFDNIDIFGLKSGSDSYTVFLTNEAHTFVADDQGNVAASNLSSGATDVRFFRGTTQYTYNQTGGTNTYKTGSITASFIITASQTVVNNDIRLTPTNVTGSSGQLSGSIIIPLIDNTNNLTFNKVYTFSIARAGGTGSNAISAWMSPSTQTVTASLSLGTFSSPSKFDIFVYETGSAMRYTTTQPPTTRGTWTIYAPAAAGTNNSTNTQLSGAITPPSVTAIRPFSSSFAIQYLDSKGNLSSYISQSHIINVVSVGQTGPGIVFTGPWQNARLYQYSEGSTNGRRDVVFETASQYYFAALQQHTSDGTNKPTVGGNAYWQELGSQDFFVAAKIAIFEESYVQNTLNVGTTNYEAGFSSANITIAGGTQYPYISIGQVANGYNNTGIWIGNATGSYRASFVSATGPYLKWDGSQLFISGNISASEGRIGGLTISSKSLFLGSGSHEHPGTPFFVSTSGDFSLGDRLSWDGTALNVSGIVSASSIIGGSGDFVGTVTANSGSIGGWNIGESVLSSTNVSMSLNAATSTISIASGSITTVVIKSGAPTEIGYTVNLVFTDLPNLSTTGSGATNSVTGSYSVPGNVAINCTGTSISRAVSRLEAGTYTITVTSDGMTANPFVTLNTGFQGRVNLTLQLQISNDATFSNPSTYAIGSVFAFANSPLASPQDYTYPASSVPITHTFTEGTWYMRLRWATAKTSITYGSFDIKTNSSKITNTNTTGNPNPELTFAKQVSFTEISDGAIQVVSSSNRYVKLIRDSGSSDRMLEVAGSVTATGNITAYYSSDKRLKENIFTIQSALDKLEKINGVEFDWSDKFINNEGGEDGYFIRKHDVGVIAQEIEQVLPEVVATRDDGYKAVRYEKIVPLLIEAIKELREEIRKLKT